jgi:hypothetical protein
MRAANLSRLPIRSRGSKGYRMAQRDKLESLYLRMRFFGPAALIGLSPGVLGASAASADQCPQKESPIATDRPDVTNSSVVLPPASFQNENGVNFSQRNGGHQFDGTNSRLRLGIAPTDGRASWSIRIAGWLRSSRTMIVSNRSLTASSMQSE